MADFSPSNRYLYATSWDGHLLRWDLAGGERGWRERGPGTFFHFYALPLSDDLVLSACDDGLHISSFSLGLGWRLGSEGVPELPVLSPDRRTVVYRHGIGDRAAIFVRDLATGERWGTVAVPRMRPVRVTRDGWLVVPSSEGRVQVYAPPRSGGQTPAETRSWLEGLTSMELEEARLPSPTCGE